MFQLQAVIFLLFLLHVLGFLTKTISRGLVPHQCIRYNYRHAKQFILVSLTFYLSAK